MMSVLYAAAPDGFDPTVFLQWGPLGAMLVALVFGFFWAKPSVDRLIADKERAEQQRDAMIMTYQKEVLPALATATAGMARMADVGEHITVSLARFDATAAAITAQLAATRPSRQE